MLEALALTAALLTADAEVRRSDGLVAWCEISRFPDESLFLQWGADHLDWLSAERKRLEWLADNRLVSEREYRGFVAQLEDVTQEQCKVMEVYRLVQCIRRPPQHASDLERLKLLRELIGDDDYFAGRLPLPVTCQRRP